MRLRLTLAIAAIALAGCGLERARTYEHVGGFVQSVDREHAQVTVSHDEIPGFMPAMTMNFDVADPTLLDGVAPGARIEFELRRSASLLSIESLRVLVPAAGANAPPPPLAEGELAPGFELVDQDGHTVRLSDWRGRAVLVDFVFTRCPGPCPIQTARLVDVQRRLAPALASRTHFASITLDPEYDSPERLGEYAASHRASLDNWSFLGGDAAVIQAVLDAYRIGTVRKPDGTLDHVVATFLIAPDGRVARRYLGLTAGANAIALDLERVLAPGSG
jgi:protein SCO1/2